MKALLQKIAQADQDFAMIQEGDRIAVGLSGGKDSTLLLVALDAYRKICPKSFEIVGIHINLGFGGEPFEPVEAYFRQQSIPVEVVPSQI